MTVIAAVVDGDRVHLASDSASVDGGGIITPKRKLYRLPMGLNDEVVVGVAGLGALGPLLVANLKLDASPVSGDDADGWAQATASAITEIAVDHQITNSNDDGRADFAALLAWRGQLWQLSHHLAIPITGGYAAIGSGDAAALGSMWSTYGDYAPQALAVRAVEASIRFHAGLAGPIQVEST